ncbi:hypothetical protein ESCO_003050 [Escovopsis weberi]|uniref:Uncharacterized protein n=1 Tax=Escovopsis weberi TaxID=150374 RepID=A0A0M8MT14_ESCWE|nr:hypothetical protein ESCO_003050 [Escovopsis weberi]
MAQAGTARIASLADGERLAGLTEKENYEIEQYEKIVQLRDMVLSGKHPTIKLPPGLKAIADSLPARVKTASVADVRSAVSKDQQAVPENLAKVVEVDAPPAAEKPVASQVACRSAQRPLTSGRTEINPILLEKSDELIRAEFQLQRQRLERSLREELEERRGSKPPQGSLGVFDLSSKLPLCHYPLMRT